LRKTTPHHLFFSHSKKTFSSAGKSCRAENVSHEKKKSPSFGKKTARGGACIIFTRTSKFWCQLVASSESCGHIAKVENFQTYLGINRKFSQAENAEFSTFSQPLTKHHTRGITA
jgi:hypothetical protein